MARALLSFSCLDVSGTANLKDDKIWQKIQAVLVSRWRNNPQVAQMFCSRRTIMARVLLNCWLFHVPLTSPRQQNLPKKIHVGVQLECRRSDLQVAQMFCSRRTIMARALLNCGCLAVYRTDVLRADNKSPMFFCWASTIMARALLNFCCLDVSRNDNLRDDQIWQKKFTPGRCSKVVGATIHKSPSCFTLVRQ